MHATTPSEICEVINLLRLQTSDDLRKMSEHAEVAMGRSMYRKQESEADMYHLTSVLCRRELLRRGELKP